MAYNDTDSAFELNTFLEPTEAEPTDQEEENSQNDDFELPDRTCCCVREFDLIVKIILGFSLILLVVNFVFQWMFYTRLKEYHQVYTVARRSEVAMVAILSINIFTNLFGMQNFVSVRFWSTSESIFSLNGMLIILTDFPFYVLALLILRTGQHCMHYPNIFTADDFFKDPTTKATIILGVITVAVRFTLVALTGKKEIRSTLWLRFYGVLCIFAGLTFALQLHLGIMAFLPRPALNCCKQEPSLKIYYGFKIPVLNTQAKRLSVFEHGYAFENRDAAYFLLKSGYFSLNIPCDKIFAPDIPTRFLFTEEPDQEELENCTLRLSMNYSAHQNRFFHDAFIELWSRREVTCSERGNFETKFNLTQQMAHKISEFACGTKSLTENSGWRMFSDRWTNETSINNGLIVKCANNNNTGFKMIPNHQEVSMGPFQVSVGGCKTVKSAHASGVTYNILARSRHRTVIV